MLMTYGLLLIAYLIGAIPFSVIIGKKMLGIDVRDHGSGNPGGTNSLRFLGKKVGALVILGDVLKGAIIVFLIRLGVFDNYDLLHPMAYGFAAAFGHSYSVYIKFGGGKAVGTSIGAISIFSPVISIISLLCLLLGIKITKFVSIGSTFYAISLIIIGLVIFDLELLFYFTLIAFLIFYRHKSNYRNIKNKVESKVTWI